MTTLNMPGARVPYQCMGQWSGSFNKGPPVGSGQWLQHVLLLVYLEHNKKYQKTSACSEGPPLPPLSFEEGVSQGSMFWRQHRVHLLPPVVGAPPPPIMSYLSLSYRDEGTTLFRSKLRDEPPIISNGVSVWVNCFKHWFRAVWSQHGAPVVRYVKICLEYPSGE